MELLCENDWSMELLVITSWVGWLAEYVQFSPYRNKILGTVFTNRFDSDTLHVEQTVSLYKAQKCDTASQELDFVPTSRINIDRHLVLLELFSVTHVSISPATVQYLPNLSVFIIAAVCNRILVGPPLPWYLRTETYPFSETLCSAVYV
jgi:hypothetical protein